MFVTRTNLSSELRQLFGHHFGPHDFRPRLSSGKADLLPLLLLLLLLLCWIGFKLLSLVAACTSEDTLDEGTLSTLHLVSRQPVGLPPVRPAKSGR